MSPAGNLSWLYHLLGYTLAIAALALLLWSLFWDRPRGRWRCPKCWYDMGGIPEPRCPECGHAPKSERHMLRTRRRKGWALIGVLLMLGAYPLFWAQRIGKEGWIGALPTSPLIWWVARYEPPEQFYSNGTVSAPTAFASELGRRAGKDELAGWQWRWMLRGVGAIRARPAWPAGRPFAIETGVPWWLQNSMLNFNVVSPFSDSELYRQDWPWSIGVLPEGARGVTLKVTAGSWHGDWYIPVRQVRRVEDAITCVTSPELDAATRSCMDFAVRRDPALAAQTRSNFGITVRRGQGPLPNDIAIAVRIDLLYAGQVRSSWSVFPFDRGDQPSFRLDVNLPDQALNDPGWTIRVRGDAAAALLDVTRPRCWTGEYTVPLSDFILK